MVLCGGVLSARKQRESGRDSKFFFSKSRLSLQKWLLSMHFWVKEHLYLVKDAASDIEVDNTIQLAMFVGS